MALDKSVFKGLFPLTAKFRNGPRFYRDEYRRWKELQPLPDGQVLDLVTHNLRFEPENYPYANRYAAENPDTLLLSTWRAASGTPKGIDQDGDPLEMSNIEFPGHFVVSPGSILQESISNTDTTIVVESGEEFVQGPAMLIKTERSGKKLWDEFEYVKIKRVNDAVLTIEREFNGSPPARSFPAGATYVAPIPWDARAKLKYTNWFFNIAADCPKDPKGRTAIDILLEPMINPLVSGGPLDLYGGIDLASGPFGPVPDNADYNWDGIADPSDVYMDGAKNVYERIRSVLGPDRVLTTSLELEFLGMINGVNQEGLASPNDPWREVSKTVNEVLAWKKLSPLPMVSLAFVQHLGDEEESLRVQMHRLLYGYSVCLGMAADVELNDGVDELTRVELFKGIENEAHWLGRPRGSIKRPGSMTANLLGNAKSNSDWNSMLPHFVPKRGTVLVENGELILRPKKFDSTCSLILKFDLRRKSDFTVYFEAISDDDKIRRRISLPRISVPVETGGVRASITRLDYLPLSFYVRGAESGGDDSVTFELRFEGGGDVRFRSMSVHAAPDTLACEFDKGVILVNPSLNGVAFDLKTLFPGRTNYRRLTAPKPRGDIPSEFSSQLKQTMNINNGEKIGSPTTIKVPERNSLFLILEDEESEKSSPPPPPDDSSSSSFGLFRRNLSSLVLVCVMCVVGSTCLFVV